MSHVCLLASQSSIGSRSDANRFRGKARMRGLIVPPPPPPPLAPFTISQTAVLCGGMGCQGPITELKHALLAHMRSMQVLFLDNSLR